MSHGQSRKSIERRQWRVFPSLEAFIVIVGVHCEISKSVVCWLPTAKSGIVKGLTYGPWSSNGAKETRSRSTRETIRSVHKAMIYCGVIFLPSYAVKGSYTNVCGLNLTHSGVVIQVFRDKKIALHREIQLSVSASTAVLYIAGYKKLACVATCNYQLGLACCNSYPVFPLTQF